MDEIRWEQRFQNFEKAFLLLREALQTPLDRLSDLEKEGIVQRFEYTFELAWKVLKDYMVYSGVVLDQSTPRQAIKQAFAANVIQDGQIWIDMLEHRNLMARTYDRDTFERAVTAISEKYAATLGRTYAYLKEKVTSE